MNIADVLGIAGQSARTMEEAQARGRAAQLDEMRLAEARRMQRQMQAEELAPLARQVGIAPAFTFATDAMYAPIEAPPPAPKPTAPAASAATATPKPTAPTRTIQGGLSPVPGGYGPGVVGEEGTLTPFERPMDRRVRKTPPTPPAKPTPAAAPPPPVVPVAPATQPAVMYTPPEVPAPKPDVLAQPIDAVTFALGAPVTEQTKNISPSQVYKVRPDAVGVDIQDAARKREELVRLAGVYQRAGLGKLYGQTLDQIDQVDNSMYYLQGMQGITELEQLNNPNRLAAVMSHFTGAPVAFRVRQDGTLDRYVNGELMETGLSRDDIVASARTYFDSAYRDTMKERTNEEFKAGLKLREELVKNYLGGERDKVKLQYASLLRSQQIADELVAAGELERIKALLNPKDKTIKGINLPDGTALLTMGDRAAIYNPMPPEVSGGGVAAGLRQSNLTVLPSFSDILGAQ